MTSNNEPVMEFETLAFRAGTRVRIRQGLGAHHEGIILSQCPGSDRLLVQVRLLGQEWKFLYDPSELDRLDFGPMIN